ncbi:MAG: LysR family transcriptional regulator [Phycisphaeraceae bacterium]|nr:LysR family transcriptional regulator [Phycisphaeraceae bacterium]MCW5754008.1 LysR family transcriptional regulator [Phycisphaeraceae bacterium]
MELTPLRYFVIIAETGHMTRAARTIGVTQPALSAMLKKLEAEVKSDLFHRTGKGVELTEAGRVFLEYARDTIRRAEAGLAAVRELMGLERGSIRIGAGATATGFILPRVVSVVRRQFPGLRFFIREAGSRAVAAAVLSGELDLGLVTLPVEHPGGDDLTAVQTIEDELRLIVPPGEGLRSDAVAGTFAWHDLAGVSMVGFEAGSAVREVIDRAAAGAGVSLDYVMELRSIEAIKHMVEAGIGAGFVSRFALEEDEGLTCSDGRITRRLAVIRRRDRVPSAAAAAFERELLTRVG